MNIVRIEPSKSKNIRNDIFKTKIVWAICRTPLELVYSQSAAIVKTSEYKTNDYQKYFRVFKAIFDQIWKELCEFWILDDKNSTDWNVIDLIALHFPSKKVLEIAC